MKTLAIVGGAGRMGQALGEGLAATGRFAIGALVDEHEPRELFGSRWVTSLDDLDAKAMDAVVDFSSPEGVLHSAAWCADNSVPLVVGATGLTAEQRSKLDDAATRVGVVVASNFSVGAALAERFAALAAPYFDRVEIIELHHDKKVDAPSGTSIATARSIAAARRAAGADVLVDPRHDSRSKARAARTEKMAWLFTRCACPGSWPIKKCSSAHPARGSRFATTPLIARASSTGLHSRSTPCPRRQDSSTVSPRCLTEGPVLPARLVTSNHE